ncbi:hypothetical protein ACLK17_19540 [Escherichia coli]
MGDRDDGKNAGERLAYRCREFRSCDSLPDKTTTGDGIVAGLQVLAAMARNHMSLHDLLQWHEMFPQILVMYVTPQVVAIHLSMSQLKP